jgi:hypothetical protein
MRDDLSRNHEERAGNHNRGQAPSTDETTVPPPESLISQSSANRNLTHRA